MAHLFKLDELKPTTFLLARREATVVQHIVYQTIFACQPLLQLLENFPSLTSSRNVDASSLVRPVYETTYR